MKFDIMYYDTVTAKVEYEDGDRLVKVTSFSNSPVKNPLQGGDMTRLELDTFIKDRCFEECNGNAKIFLEDMGLSAYNPWEIVKITHGVMLEDYTWIRFEGEHLKWEDVKHARG